MTNMVTNMTGLSLQLDDSAALNELARTTVDKDLGKITSIASAGIAIIEGLRDGATEEDWQRIAQFAVGIAADKLRSVCLRAATAPALLPDRAVCSSRTSLPFGCWARCLASTLSS